MTPFAAVRRQLLLAGGHPANGAADAISGRGDGAEYRLAELVDPPMRAIAVGAPEPWREDVAFLDGTQHVELLGYVGIDPVIGADVRASVRLRRDRQLRGAASALRSLVIAPPRALAALDMINTACELIAIDDDVPHPMRDVQQARSHVDRARAALEVAVARDFRRQFPVTWLIVDGSLAATPGWGDDARMLGVVKSHAMLPFTDEELHIYVRLPCDHRSPLFKPASRRVTPLYSWALRLHDCAGHDLFHGLVRIEAPATAATVASADALSRHLLAERAPRANDPRADRLLYGVHDVERFLGAQA